MGMEWPQILESYILDHAYSHWDIVKMSRDEFKVESTESSGFLHAKTYGDIVSVIGQTSAGKKIKRQFPLDGNIIANLTALLVRVRTASEMVREAGRGLELPDVFKAIYGTGASAKAFRSLATYLDNNFQLDSSKASPEALALAELSMPTIRAIRGSQALKELLNQYRDVAHYVNITHNDPISFVNSMGKRGLKDLKLLLNLKLGNGATLSADVYKFLREWVNTNGYAMPKPFGSVALELERFRPDGTILLYRGIRFNDIGELVQFTRTYANTGKPFPFSSDRFSSWTKSKTIAERFGRYRAASSQNEAMFGWASRVRSGKSYDGYGGYIVGARVRPEQCLADLTKLNFQGQHGDEAEVIVRPNTPIVCKVYATFGDVELELEQFRKDPPQSIEKIVKSSAPYNVSVVSIDGDIATYKWVDFFSMGYHKETPKTPRAIAETEIVGGFRKNLYEARWLDDYRVQFRPMLDDGAKLAAAWGGMVR